MAVTLVRRNRGGIVPAGLVVDEGGLHVEWPHPPDARPDWWPWHWPTPTVHERVRRVRGHVRWEPTHTLTRHRIGGLLGCLAVLDGSEAELTDIDGNVLRAIPPCSWLIYPSEAP